MADIVYPGEPAGGPLNSGAMPKNFDLRIYKGDYLELIIIVKDELGEPVPLGGFTAAAQLKKNYDESPELSFDATVSTTETGRVRLFLSSESTSSLDPGTYIWDFQITDSLGNNRTYLAGDVFVYNEVTT